MSSVQFLSNENGEVVFAVLPIATYRKLIAASPQDSVNDRPALSHSASLLSADGRYVQLPYGGFGTKLDVLRLADFCARKGITCFPISNRAQAFEKFSPEEVQHGLDPLIRRFFLPENSSYRNTMQAVKDVVDALVATGIFDHTKVLFPYYRRKVNALQVNQAALQDFLEKHGPLDPKDQIPISG